MCARSDNAEIVGCSWDGRLLHCGGANRNDRNEPRVLLYVTFRNPAAVGETVDRSACTLKQLRRELSDTLRSNARPGSATH